MKTKNIAEVELNMKRDKKLSLKHSHPSHSPPSKTIICT